MPFAVAACRRPNEFDHRREVLNVRCIKRRTPGMAKIPNFPRGRESFGSKLKAEGLYHQP